MSEPNAPAPPGEDEVPTGHDDPIQFDQAEYSTQAPHETGASCANCHQPIADTYFVTGGKVICAPCRQRIEEAFRGGSRMARGMRSLLFGMLAALAGAIMYYVIVRVTGYNIGLIAIVLGAMVGGGVRAGSGNRGGRFYQLLAVFLTYSAIVGMYLPLLAEAAFQHSKQERQQNNNPAGIRQPFEPKSKDQPKVPATAAKGASQPDNQGLAGQAKNAGNPTAIGDLTSVEKKTDGTTELADNKDPPSLAGFLIAVGLLMGSIFTFPVRAAFHAPISGLIYAFALWEAWKINKKVHLTFNGPFRVSAAAEPALPPEVLEDGA